MKGIFLYPKKINNVEVSGVDKKVLRQVEVFNNSGLNCQIINQPVSIIKSKAGILYKIYARLPFTDAMINWKYKDEFDIADYLYFRKPFFLSLTLLRLMKKIRRRNPNIKIIMEIPTYPYKHLFIRKKSNLPFYFKDTINCSKLVNIVDRIAIQNNIDELFNIPTLRFSNGVNLDDIPIRTPVEDPNGIINICAVALMKLWQGYERVFYGLYNYYQNGGTENIIIHMAGEGEELGFYKKLVDKLNLSSHVIFYGFLHGHQLENIYNISEVALDTFGRYKTKNKISTSLKSREYLAKGIPIITGCITDVISPEYKYYLEFSSNDSVLDFDKIISFCKDLYSEKSRREVAGEMRSYASEVCDISKNMDDVVNYIRGV